MEHPSPDCYAHHRCEKLSVRLPLLSTAGICKIVFSAWGVSKLCCRWKMLDVYLLESRFNKQKGICLQIQGSSELMLWLTMESVQPLPPTKLFLCLPRRIQIEGILVTHRIKQSVEFLWLRQTFGEALLDWFVILSRRPVAFLHLGYWFKRLGWGIGAYQILSDLGSWKLGNQFLAKFNIALGGCTLLSVRQGNSIPESSLRHKCFLFSSLVCISI